MRDSLLSTYYAHQLPGTWEIDATRNWQWGPGAWIHPLLMGKSCNYRDFKTLFF